jgi:hypothetical protein
MEQELQLQQDEEEEEEAMRDTGIYTFLRRPAVVYPMVHTQDIFFFLLFSFNFFASYATGTLLNDLKGPFSDSNRQI